MFLTDDDYVMIGSEALKVVSQASPAVRAKAEAIAITEASGYLRPDYDIEAIFSARDNDRDLMVVTCVADIALYHMTCALPGRMNLEVRDTRYKRALDWLAGIQSGKIVPDLPEPAAIDGGTGSAPAATEYFSNPKLRHEW